MRPGWFIKAAALTVLLSAIVAIVSAMAVGEIFESGKVEKLVQENADLRAVEARHASVKKLEAGAPPDVNMEAVKNASYDLGTPASILVAVRRLERGSQGYELGNKGKTAVFAKCVPVEQWQYYEASRSLNRLVWKWALVNPAYRRDLFKALGGYTRPDRSKDWSRNVDRFQKEAAGKPRHQAVLAQRRRTEP